MILPFGHSVWIAYAFEISVTPTLCVCFFRIPLNLLSAPGSAHCWEFRFEFVAVDFSYLSIIHSERIFSRVCSFLLCFFYNFLFLFFFFFFFSRSDERYLSPIRWRQSKPHDKNSKIDLCQRQIDRRYAFT